jgi:hypothetical protein
MTPSTEDERPADGTNSVGLVAIDADTPLSDLPACCGERSAGILDVPPPLYREAGEAVS